MSRTRSKSSIRVRRDDREPVDVDYDSKQLLEEISKKIIKSSALNGGFDALMIKVEKIDDATAANPEKIEEIHKAIYHPDDGLFARIKVVEISRDHDEKEEEKGAIEFENNIRMVSEHDVQLKDLSRFRSRVYSALTWLLVTLITGLAGLLVKIAYDFASGHIHFK